mgnify:CR=1 FL=1
MEGGRHRHTDTDTHLERGKTQRQRNRDTRTSDCLSRLALVSVLCLASMQILACTKVRCPRVVVSSPFLSRIVERDSRSISTILRRLPPQPSRVGLALMKCRMKSHIMCFVWVTVVLEDQDLYKNRKGIVSTRHCSGDVGL